MYKILFFIAIILLSIAAEAQKNDVVERDTLFIFHFEGNEKKFDKAFIRETVTTKEELENESYTYTAYNLEKITESELHFLDTMYIDDFSILNFGLSYKCCGLESSSSKNSNYFDKSKLEILRTYCKCKEIWIMNLILQNNETKRTHALNSFQLY